MGVSIDLSNQIRSTLKTFGLMAGKGMGRTFENRVRELIDARPTIAAIVEGREEVAPPGREQDHPGLGLAASICRTARSTWRAPLRDAWCGGHTGRPRKQPRSGGDDPSNLT